jgi:hypothetical protein
MTTIGANELFSSTEAARKVGTVSISPALAIAAFGSIGAGAIHAASIGVHSDFEGIVRTFALLATLQIGWGVVALVRRTGVLLALGGVAINAGAVIGWIFAKTIGIGFINGFQTGESPEFVDTAAMALAAIAVIGGILAATISRKPAKWFGPALFTLTAIATAIFTTFGMVQAGAHNAEGHAHGAGAEASDGHAHGGGTGGTGGDGHGGHEVPVAMPAKEYDPTKPIDLSGAEGVSPEQQARAENLIAITLLRLPKYADYRTAERDGFRSIHDGVTGTEHFINVAYFDDGKILNPDYPESLVYDVDRATGKRTLSAAMFMMPSGARLTDVPDIGGPLTQWHIHNNLCFTAQGTVAGLTDSEGKCPAGLNNGTQAPMIHVWIRKHECGPFAALEGVGGGQIKEGETKLCDHAHGGA